VKVSEERTIWRGGVGGCSFFSLGDWIRRDLRYLGSSEIKAANTPPTNNKDYTIDTT
jgi:hypothetical protein